MNPVDDTKFVGPLVKALQRHVDVCAESLTELPEKRRHSVAATWVFMSALVAWAEDHRLVDPWLRKGAADLRSALDSHPEGMRLWLSQAVASLAVHPATRCLTNPLWVPALREGMPSEQACRALVDWWTNDAPCLAYEVDEGPASITGWLVGDLLQLVSDERRKAHALCQTPWWVADFIIDLTLIPAADEFRDDVTLMTIDPCCGTGHFLIRKIDYLYELYTTGSLTGRQAVQRKVTGWTPCPPAEAIQRILDGVTGVELDPLTTAVARLRTTVAIGELMHRAGLLDVARLDTIPHTVKPRIAAGDSLLAGVASPKEYAKLHPHLAAIDGNPEIPVGQQDLLAHLGAA